MSSWKNAINIQRYYCVDVPVLQPNPVYLSVQEVNTVEELETLSQSRDLVLMYALAIREQILGPHHEVTQLRLYWLSRRYRAYGEYRRCIDVCRYALQLQNVGSNPLITSQHLCNSFIAGLYHTCWFYCDFYQQLTNANYVLITFEEVLEVLQMATTNVENATGVIIPRNFERDVDLNLIFMKLVLHLVSLITKLEMHSDQQFRFKQIVYRLVRCQLKNKQGKTLLHLSVLESTSHIKAKFIGKKSENKRFFTPFPNIAVVELLLECGANVNAVDDESNTTLHLCSEALRNLKKEKHQDILKRIAVLLLNCSAHVDMVNIFGMRAADGLTSSSLEMNMMNLVSLKCLAANAVVNYRITYAGYVNDLLESFVQMHSSVLENIEDVVENFLRVL